MGHCGKMCIKLLPLNVELLGYQPDDIVKDHLHRAKACIFAAIEDFGIASAESQGYGCPVIAYGYGGIRDIVLEGKTGIFFYDKTEEALCEAINKFENGKPLSSQDCIKNAKRFEPDSFMNEIKEFVDHAWKQHIQDRGY